MGNCQAAEVATVVIHHPGKGKVDRVYWSLNASQVMEDNPGYYVATIVTARPRQNSSTATTNRNNIGTDGAIKYVKLLSPDEMLHIGHAYRLVSFEDVLKEFGSKKRVRLSKLIAKEKERRTRENIEDEQEDGSSKLGHSATMKKKKSNTRTNNLVVEGKREESEEIGVLERNMNMELFGSRGFGNSSMPLKQGHWKPSLKTIAEIGS